MGATLQKCDSGQLFTPGPAKDFLRALGKCEVETRFRAFAPKGHPHHSEIRPRTRTGFEHRTLNQWQQEGRGLYFVVNDGGNKAAEITDCRALFCEWDNRPIDWQVQAWEELGLPKPTVMVSTGGKSVHCYWVLDLPINKVQWQPLQNRLIAHAGSDPACKDASRVMRLPGGTYLGADGEPAGRTEIIHSSGIKYTAEELAQCLPELVLDAPAPRESAPVLHYPTRGMSEIEEALQCIPSRVPGHGTYENYRDVLWGLVDAVHQAGGSIDHAIALMEAHSPSALCRWEVDQVARSGDGRIKAGTFWKAAQHHGYRLSHRLLDCAATPQGGRIGLNCTGSAGGLRQHDAPDPSGEGSPATPEAAGSLERLSKQQMITADPLQEEAAEIDRTYNLLLDATLASDHSRIDALLARTYRLGISRDRTQAELMRRWAARRGLSLAKPTGPTSGRIIGKADPGRGLQQLQPGFMLDRDLHLLCADAGSGKTFLTLELAAVLSIGSDGFLDQEEPRQANDARRTVLYIASDGGPTAWAMVCDYADRLELVDRGALIDVWAESETQAPWCLTLPNLEKLAERVAVGDLAAVMIDTANSIFQQANLNPYTGPVDQYLRLLKAIVCPHAALWLNGHTNRSGQGMKAIGGHPAWQEVPAAIHRIEKLNGLDGQASTYRWHVAKFRGESPRSFNYQHQEGSFVITEGAIHENVGDLLLLRIAEREAAGMATNTSALVTESQRSKDSIYSALNRLRQRGLIRSKGKANATTPEGRRVAAQLG